MEPDYDISEKDYPEVRLGFDVERKVEVFEDEEMRNDTNCCPDKVSFNRAHLMLTWENEANRPENHWKTHEDQAEVLTTHPVWKRLNTAFQPRGECASVLHKYSLKNDNIIRCHKLCTNDNARLKLPLI